jgi:methyltransferase
LALHLPLLAILFTILNAVVLAIRIPAENRALVVASSRKTTLGVR